jgi:hypothetical protein
MPSFPINIPSVRKTATEFLDAVSHVNLFNGRTGTVSHEKREELALELLMEGNVPSHMQSVVSIDVPFTAQDGSAHTLTIFAQPDGCCIGTDDDFLRYPLTPVGAQKYADAMGCILPTTKMVDIVWKNAVNKLVPRPWGPPYDNTMNDTHRHVVQNRKINDQLRAAGADPTKLTAGHKKDIVISNQLSRTGMCAIYGWHQANGNVIQTLYNGHSREYTDYSEHARLFLQECILDGALDSIGRILQDPDLCHAISNEGPLKFLRQP